MKKVAEHKKYMSGTETDNSLMLLIAYVETANPQGFLAFLDANKALIQSEDTKEACLDILEAGGACALRALLKLHPDTEIILEVNKPKSKIGEWWKNPVCKATVFIAILIILIGVILITTQEND
jgi:hypothetical protein